MSLRVFFPQIMSQPEQAPVPALSVATAPEGIEDGSHVDPWNVGNNIDYNKLVRTFKFFIRLYFHENVIMFLPSMVYHLFSSYFQLLLSFTD